MDTYRTLWETSQTLCMESTGSNDKAWLCQVTHDAWEGVLFLQNELQSVEEDLDVGQRWTPQSPEFQKATAYIHVRTYQ